jgi:hypothetical protein
VKLIKEFFFGHLFESINSENFKGGFLTTMGTFWFSGPFGGALVNRIFFN